MAKVLDSHEFVRGGPLKGSKWDQYMDGRIHLIEDADINGSKQSAVQSLYMAAKRHGKKVHTQRTDDGIVVQAYTPED